MSGENVNQSMLPREAPEPRAVEPPKLMCAFNTRYAACLRQAEMVFFADEHTVGFCGGHAVDVYEEVGPQPTLWESDEEHTRYMQTLTDTLNDFTEGRKRA